MKAIISLFRLPFDLLAALERIEDRLAAIQNHAKQLADCIDERNHRNRKSLRTAHWND